MVAGAPSQVTQGDLQTSFVQSNPALAAADKYAGWTIMSISVAVEFLTFATAVISFIKGPSALGLFTAAACVCTLVMTLLTFMLWHTFCLYDPRIRKIMKKSTRFTPTGFMRIGFMPIPAAASVGLLMFVIAVFVSPSIQPGGMLQQGTAGVFLAWLPGETCRASSIERADYLTAWDARFDRSAPSAHQTTTTRIMSLFRYEAAVEAPNGAEEGSCFNAPYQFDQDDVIDPVTGKDRDISNLVHPEGDTEGRNCLYHCVLWKTINLQTLLTASGTISVGAGIVVVFTELLSSFLGLPTITEDTSARQLEELLSKIGPDTWSRRLMKPFQASMFCCAVPIIAIGVFLKYYLVSKIDADGFSTQDYYVSYCIWYSVAMVTIMRVFHLYEARPQLFTRNLWHQGLDNFIITKDRLDSWNKKFGAGQFQHMKDIGDDLVVVSIDLYQWMHLRGNTRRELLINYCRRPGKEGTEVGAKLTTLAPIKVHVTHEVELGDAGKCTCEKIVLLDRPGLELTVVGWKDVDNVNCKVMIAGKQETVSVNKQECLEKGDEWELECFQTAVGACGDVEDNNGSDPTAQRNPVSALQQQLLTLEQKMNALEQKTTKR